MARPNSQPDTQNVAQFAAVMKFFCVLYAVGGILFYAFHSLMTQLMQMPGSQDHFWVTLATSMMAMLSYLSWLSAKHPHEKTYVQVHMLSKTVSVTGFLLGFLLDHGLWGFLLSAVTDFAVIVIVLFFYRRANAAVETTAVA